MLSTFPHAPVVPVTTGLDMVRTGPVGGRTLSSSVSAQKEPTRLLVSEVLCHSVLSVSWVVHKARVFWSSNPVQEIL